MKKLKSLLPLLRVVFSKWKYKNNVDANEKDDGATLDLDMIEKCISSGKFNAYLELVEAVDSIPSGLADWSEHCPCHQRLLKGKSMQ